MSIKSFSKFLEEEIPTIDGIFDNEEEGSILRLGTKEDVTGIGKKFVYVVYRGRTEAMYHFRIVDDQYGSEFSECLPKLVFFRRNRDVTFPVNRLPYWLTGGFTKVGNINDIEERKFK